MMVEGDQIYGDGVNVAARLESIVEPGGICISESVYGQSETSSCWFTRISAHKE